MFALPIVSRELLIAARKPITFWSRVAAVLVTAIVATGFLLVAYLSQNLSDGSGLFATLATLALIAALLSGVFLTSDCVSEEKREGTLGLLFLTELRGRDVLSGKLISTSVRGLYGLLAVLPVLAVSFVMGGVSWGQFWRTAAALISALIFSLCAGLLVSTLSRNAQRAVAGTFFLVLAFNLLTFLVDEVLALVWGRTSQPWTTLLSPVYLFGQARSILYMPFLKALLGVNLCSLLFFALACVAVPRSWQDRPRAFSSRRSALKNSSAQPVPNAARHARRQRLLDQNPVFWLVCRGRWESMGIWLLVAVSLAAFILGVVFVEGTPLGFFWQSVVGLAVLGLYVWAASNATRFLVDARRSRAIELILASPLQDWQIIEGHWRGILRMFGLPIALFLFVSTVGSLLFTVGGMSGMPNAMPPNSSPINMLAVFAVSVVSSFFVTIANLLAIAWFGMWMGLTSRTANGAALKTLLFVQVIPWFGITTVGSMMVALFLAPFLMSGGAANMPMMSSWIGVAMSAVPAALTIVKDVVFIIISRRVLYASFREKVLRDYLFVVAQPTRMPQVAAPPGSS